MLSGHRPLWACRPSDSPMLGKAWQHTQGSTSIRLSRLLLSASPSPSTRRHWFAPHAPGCGPRFSAVRPLAGKAVLVVESPTKAKKIQQFLGNDYKVFASYGHVRDLSPHAGSVLPDQDFTLKWELMRGAGPRLAEIQQALQEGSGSGSARAKGSKAGSGDCCRCGHGPTLVLATDPDREGEAISWHLMEELQRRGALPSSSQVQRITFTEITKAAVLKALANPRQVSSPLVDAYLARRALDYLVGFGISPVLWRRLPGAKSAGRVQSVALRLVSAREDEIEAFTPREYWSIDVRLRAPDGKVVTASLVQVDGTKLHPVQGIPNQQRAQQLVDRIHAATFRVHDVKRKSVQRSPPPPFITSSLQQEASNKLGYGAARTMKAAQQLYEGAGTGEGLITYMRTDGLQMSEAAVDEVRRAVESGFGAAFLPGKPRVYQSRAKNAQEAHEAIRPTRASVTPASLSDVLPRELLTLYELVWRRTLACQMTNAVLDQVGVDFLSVDGSLKLRATGSAVQFAGYLQAYERFYQKGSSGSASATPEDAAEQADEDGRGSSSSGGGKGGENSEAAAAVLASLKAGDAMALDKALANQHFTRPPPRYTDASLIKALEEKGIGRPSTYASILSVLQARGYVVKEGRSLQASPLGRVLSAFLAHYFPTYVDYDFTSSMEEQLDEVSGGRSDWKALMHAFWGPFHASVEAMSAVSTTDVFNVLDQEMGHHFFKAPAQPLQQLLLPAPTSDSDPDHATTATKTTTDATAATRDPRVCPRCTDGSGRLVLKPSRSGGFIGCTNWDKGCTYSRSLDAAAGVLDEQTGEYVPAGGDARVLGMHPDSGLPIVVKTGPYGAYLEVVGSTAVASTAAPVGAAADTSAGVAMADGGPRDGAAGGEEVASTSGDGGGGVTGGEAVGGAKKRGRPSKAVKAAEAAAEPKRGKRGKNKAADVPKPQRARLPKGKDAASVTLEEALSLLSLPRLLGSHPDDGLPVLANMGRYGPYVAHGGINATLGKGVQLQDVSLDQAVQLLIAKRDKVKEQEAKGITPRGRKQGGGGKGVGQLTAGKGRRGRNGQVAEEEGSDVDGSEAGTSDDGRQGASATVGKRGKAAAVQAGGGQAAAGGKGPGVGAGQGTAAGRTITAAATTAAAADGAGTPTPGSKRAPNPYANFVKRNFDEARRENPDASFAELTKVLAQRWRGMGEDERAAYRPTGEEQKGTGAGASASGGKPVPARKRSQSAAQVAYAEFCRQYMEEVRQDSPPGTRASELAKALGARWRALSEEQRRAFAPAASAAASAATSTAVGTTVGAKEEQDAAADGGVPGPQDAGSAAAPRHPVTPRQAAYNAFFKAHLEEVKRELPGAGRGRAGAWIKVLAQRWRAMSEEEKQGYSP